MQLKSIILSKLSRTLRSPIHPIQIEKMSNFSGPKKILWRIYIIFNSLCSFPISTNTNFWTWFSKSNFNKSNNTNVELRQVTFIHRMHYTGEKWHKMGFNGSDRCTHCSQNTADTDLHNTWHCSSIRHFVVRYRSIISHTGLPALYLQRSAS